MVSFYFYSFFENERSNAKLVQITRKELPFADYEDVRKNLPRFIEYKFTRNTYPRFTWSEFVKDWVNENAIFVKYEDLVRDTSAELGKAIRKLLRVDADPNRLREIAEKYAFRNQAQRSPGEENASSFLRKGIVGDWKNYFTKEAREMFHHLAGKELIRLGYEEHDGWV